jgi:nucleoside-diphosphate-sugar epimerase
MVKKVLVLGSAGFIGSNILSNLIKEGLKITENWMKKDYGL